MRYELIYDDLTRKQTKEFLKLSRDKRTEKQILAGKHILSGYFDAVPFMVCDETGKVYSRCIFTHYKDEKKGYIGYFESLDNSKTAKLLFEKVREFSKDLGITELIGPYNCSFWLGSRIKLNNFNDTYTGEPYNPHYYPRLWFENGFEVFEEYHSNIYKVPDMRDKKCAARLEYFKNNGFIFTDMTFLGFKKQLCEIYELLSSLYSGFPEYKNITKDEFLKLYLPLKKILNLKRVLLVYKDDKLAAFLVSFPDYSKTKSLFDFFKTRKDPKRLIFMYLGVDPFHKGLGSALAEIMRDMQENRLSVGALIHGQKSLYYGELVTKRYGYALLKKYI